MIATQIILKFNSSHPNLFSREHVHYYCVMSIIQNIMLILLCHDTSTLDNMYPGEEDKLTPISFPLSSFPICYIHLIISAGFIEREVGA